MDHSNIESSIDTSSDVVDSPVCSAVPLKAKPISHKTVLKQADKRDVTKAVRYDLLIYCLHSDIILYFLLVAATSLRAGFQVYLS